MPREYLGEAGEHPYKHTSAIARTRCVIVERRRPPRAQTRASPVPGPTAVPVVHAEPERLAISRTLRLMGGSPPRVPFTVQLPIDIAEQLRDAAQLHAVSDEVLAVEALVRGLDGLPELTVAWMTGSRARLSPAAVIALGRPVALAIDLLGNEFLELSPAITGVEVRYDKRGRASFAAGALRALAGPQTVRLRKEGMGLVGRLVDLLPSAPGAVPIATDLPGLERLDVSSFGDLGVPEVGDSRSRSRLTGR